MLKIGDRVRVIKEYCSAKKGMEGVIKAKEHRGDRWGIEFDDRFRGGHVCGGKTKDGHGHWVDPENLELIKTKDEKIVITHDGKTTLARLYRGKTVVKSAEAKCDPRDEFSFAVGAEIALERLMEEKKEEPPKFDKAMLTNGRFGYKTNTGWFVVVGNVFMYQRGFYDNVSRVLEDGSFPSGERITYIVEAISFNGAKGDPKEVIWCAPDFDPKKV